MYQFSETFWDARKSFSEILRNWISFYGPPGGLKPMWMNSNQLYYWELTPHPFA